MRKPTLKAIREHALSEYPREACGLILLVDSKETYRPCINLAAGNDSFVLDPQGYAEAEDMGEILMVVHSHPDAHCRPSEADKVMCEESQLPWLIVSVYKDLITGEMNADDYVVFEPSGYEAPLIGRTWAPPRLDCFSLIKDYYQRELGIALPEFEVEARTTKWWDDPGNTSLYMNHFTDAGFVRVDGGPQKHDGIIMEIGSKAGPNHAAIYLGDESGLILHHSCERLSSRAIYGGYWLRNTRLIVRHKSKHPVWAVLTA